jgi:ParB family chromosome partitioning protein
MSNPKDRSSKMKLLFGSVDRTELEKHLLSPADENRKVSSGAVKSMQQSFSAVEAENDRLRKQLECNEAVVEIDADRIIPSFIRDRIDLEGSPEFPAFVDGIREVGQKLPILVRPVQEKPGYYQAAYGHRRLRACQILGRPVLAIIHNLSDQELVLAQGVENSRRANLSFVEQALFATELKKRGFDRETIALALGRGEDKGLAYISILTTTVAALPEELIRKIGAAPSIGRPKWEKLGAFFRDQKLPAELNSVVNGLVASEKWEVLKSDERFMALLNLLNRKAEQKAFLNTINLGSGLSVTTKQTAKATQISIPHDQVPGLSEWLLKRLPELVLEFQEHRKKEATP